MARGRAPKAQGWRGAVLIYVPLIYLIFVGGAVAKYSHGARAAAGFAVLDIEIPALDEQAAATVLADQLPSCRVVILTTFGRAGYSRRAMEAGAVGFVVKDASRGANRMTRSLSVRGHATDLCFAEVKYGSSNVCTHHVRHRDNRRGHFGVRQGYEAILLGNDLGPTRDDGVKPT